MTRTGGTAIFAALFLVSSLWLNPAGAAPAPASDLAVTSPPDPVSAPPGSVATTTLRVADVGKDPLTVRITAEQVKLLNNGATQLIPKADPTFGARTSVSPQQLTLQPHQEQPVTISVTMPHVISPNDYFLGFLVSPVLDSPSVRVVNDVGALVVLNVPGPRNRALEARLDLPHFSFSSSVTGSIVATSVGKSTLQFTSDTQVSGFVTPKPSLLLEKPHFLPPGLSRRVAIHFSSWLGLGYYTVRSTLVYDKTDQRTGQVVLSQTVFVVSPYWLILPAGLVTLWFVRRRRKRKRLTNRRPVHAPQKSRVKASV